MRIRAILAIGFSVLLLAGCVVGSGDLTSSERTVEGFNQIQLATSGDVQVDITGTESLVIEAEENILELLTTDVVDGVLVLGSDTPFSSSRGITYTITAAALDGVEVSGSGDVEVDGVDSAAFIALITGSGSIRPSGRCTTLSVEISGSGTYDGIDLACSIGRVEVAGSGDAIVDVSDTLEATVSGSGRIEYHGDPQLSSNVVGSGDIEQG
jgi:hypothetical protein